MTCLKGLCGVVALSALTLGAVELETAGELLVDLDASTLTGYAEKSNVERWPNTGTMPDFAHVNTHNKTTRPTYQIRNGAPAVRFAGSGTGSMTNGVPTPVSLTGNNPWTVEAWIAMTQSQDTRYWLTFSPYYKVSSSSAEALTRAAFRLDSSNSAVDHNTYNLYWGRSNQGEYHPAVGDWYHICLVHEASGYERVYLNGRLTSVGNTILNLTGDDPCYIIISGIYKVSSSTWERQPYADYGHLRIQTGALTAAQVISNYNAEKEHYGVTDTPDTLWTDGATWFNNKALALDDNLIIEGDQPLVIDNGASNAVHYLTVNASKNTGLTLDNGSTLTVAGNNSTVELGNRAGGTFTLSIPNGEFATAANSLTIGGPYNTGIGVVGGLPDAVGAITIRGGSLRVGQYPGSSGDLTIKTNGVVNVESTFRIADGDDAQGHVTIEQGGELTVLGAAYICSGTGTGVLDVYGTFTSGTPDTTPNIYLTANSARGSGTLNLHPGSVLNNSILRVDGNVTTTTGTVNIDDATIRIQRQRTSLVEPPVIFNIKNRMTVDVPADVSSTIRTTIHDLTENGVAEIVKTGEGTLILLSNDSEAASDLSSTFTVKEGLLTIGKAGTINASATIKLEGGAVSADYTGGAAEILACIDKESVGGLVIHGNNAAEDLDLSEYPGVTIIPDGAITITGTIIPYQNRYVFYPKNGIMIYSGNIADGAAGAASVEIYGEKDTDGVTLSGLNDGMSGNISVYKGILGISGSAAAAGNPASTKLYLAEGTSLKLDAAVGDTFLTTRLAEGSKPAAILLTDNSANCNIDLSNLPGCRVGTDKTGSALVHTGTILPDNDNVYLLGGGAVPYYQTSNPGFQPSTMGDTTAGPARVEVGSVGIVNLSNTANTYSGGTSIIDGGAVFATADGFGAIPAAFDEDNIYINGGVLRNGNANFALAPTRGVKVGPDGAELHPWGAYLLEIPGGLTGAGPLQITDGGFITLSGANNTFQGPVTVTQAAQELTIGGDTAFSWASTAGITTAGKVILKNAGDNTFNDVISGAGGLVKQGDGTMTLAKSQPYSGATTVEAGTLVLPNGVTLSNTSSFRNNGEVVFDALDALGTGTIYGNGRFVVAGAVDLDSSRIIGTPSFEVRDGASLGVDTTVFGIDAEVRLDGGSTMTLGAGTVDKLDGFDRFVLNGSAALDGDGLKLTPNESGKVGAAFFPSRVYVNGPWEATFSYQAGEHDAWTTDLLGAALVLHNDPAGPAALGSSAGANLGCTFAKSLGIIMRVGTDGSYKDRYGFTNAGTISDDTSARTGAIKANDGSLVTISASYNGTVLHAEWNYKGTVRTRDWTVDIASVLGSDIAWIGFTGATGASTGCGQTISGFSFRGAAYTAVPAGISEPGNISSAGWANSRYPAAYTTLDDGTPAFELTANATYVRSSIWNNTRISVNRPFTASFKYRVTDHTASPADGMAIAIQNYDTVSTNCYGQTASSLGIIYGTPRERTVGWGVNIYKNTSEQCFKFVLDGSFNGSNVPLNLWDLSDGQDTEFTLSYDLRALTLTAKRGDQTLSASREVDLISAMNGTSAWIGFTGGTGGSSARQLVYDFTFAYDEVDLSSLYANPFVVEGAAQMNLGLGTVGFADLTLKDGAAITVGAESGSTLDLAGTTLEGGATITSATAPIVLEGTIAFDSDTGILKLVGDVCANGKVKLALTSVKGIRDLIDLTEATTSLTVDDFEVAGDLPSRMHLDMKNGKVRIWREAATMITIR